MKGPIPIVSWFFVLFFGILPCQAAHSLDPANYEDVHPKTFLQDFLDFPDSLQFLRMNTKWQCVFEGPMFRLVIEKCVLGSDEISLLYYNRAKKAGFSLHGNQEDTAGFIFYQTFQGLNVSQVVALQQKCNLQSRSTLRDTLTPEEHQALRAIQNNNGLHTKYWAKPFELQCPDWLKHDPNFELRDFSPQNWRQIVDRVNELKSRYGGEHAQL